MVTKIWGNNNQKRLVEEKITFLVLDALNDLRKRKISFTSGDADSLFRIFNRIYFKIRDIKSCEPSSYQRQLIFKEYPEIFPRKKI